MVQVITQPYTYNRLARLRTFDATSNDPGDLQLDVQGILHKGVGVVPVIAVGYIRRVRAGSSRRSGCRQLFAIRTSACQWRPAWRLSMIPTLSSTSRTVVRCGVPNCRRRLALSHPLFEERTGGKLGGVVEFVALHPAVCHLYRIGQFGRPCKQRRPPVCGGVFHPPQPGARRGV